MKKNQKATPIGGQGFTLIELLIVIAIIAIIAAVAFVALDPLTRFQDARDSTRWTDVTSILAAIKVDQVDNGGNYLDTELTTDISDDEYYMIGICADGEAEVADCGAVTIEEDCVDLSDLVTEGYLSSVPIDPSSGAAAKTDYYLIRAVNGSFTVGACDPEGGSAISVSR